MASLQLASELSANGFPSDSTAPNFNFIFMSQAADHLMRNKNKLKLRREQQALLYGAFSYFNQLLASLAPW